MIPFRATNITVNILHVIESKIKIETKTTIFLFVSPSKSYNVMSALSFYVIKFLHLPQVINMCCLFLVETNAGGRQQNKVSM